MTKITIETVAGGLDAETYDCMVSKGINISLNGKTIVSIDVLEVGKQAGKVRLSIHSDSEEVEE